MNADDPDLRKIIDALRLGGHYGGPPVPPLPPGAVAGNGDGMEPRVAKLEAHMEHVRVDLEKLSSVPAELAALKVKVDHLPTKGWMITALSTALVVLAGLVTFSEKLHALLG